MKPILVSACLLGAACKYSGGDNLCPKVAALVENIIWYPSVPNSWADFQPQEHLRSGREIG